MTDAGDRKPDRGAFQWRLYDGGEWRWSREHTADGPCPSCCCNGPVPCADCGGRCHSEPVEGVGSEVPHETCCQTERVNEYGDVTETREVGPR